MKYIAQVILSLSLVACATTTIENDDYYSEKLIGIWGSKSAKSNTIWGYDVYFEDGYFHGFGRVEYDDGSRAEDYMVITGKWYVKDGMSCITVETTTVPNILAIGRHWCDKIIEITEKTFSLYSPEDNYNATLYRVNKHEI